MSQAVWTPAELLSDEFVERLWRHLPLHTFCDCADEWDDDIQEFVMPACDCERKTIPAVRNCLAAALGEPQVSFVSAPKGSS